MLSPPRIVAFEILRQVERGGFASDLLLEQTAALDSRDAGLAEEIVLGPLRLQAQLDFLIEHFSGKPAARLDAEVRIALRIGIYQMRYLERVPDHAAVGESVELVKRARKRSAAGFVNAVLRKVGRDPVTWPDPTAELSHPAWMLERWERQYGADIAERIARANLRRPETYMRGRRVQDIGSQGIVPLLELEAGQTFLDVAAAPGNKTAQALETAVRAVACDRSLTRLNVMRELGCPLVVLDATAPLPFRTKFDRILVDAPCSGTGTLARNPEIKWRLQPADLAAHQARQTAMLRNALERLAPGGRLVYSTCSLEREENEDVVASAQARPEHVWRNVPGVDAGDGFFAAVLRSD